MPELDCDDTEMRHYSITPNGPVQGVPVWQVVSGGGTLLDDPTHADWEPTLPEGHQKFLVSNTLADAEPGPQDTVYTVEADVDLGGAVELLVETITLHVHNRATSLNGQAKAAVPKPAA